MIIIEITLCDYSERLHIFSPENMKYIEYMNNEDNGLTFEMNQFE